VTIRVGSSLPWKGFGHHLGNGCGERGLVVGHGVDVEIPASGHNPMFEQPLALAGVLRTLLTAWFPVVSRRGEANG
jgi:hypothetical protein